MCPLIRSFYINVLLTCPDKTQCVQEMSQRLNFSSVSGVIHCSGDEWKELHNQHLLKFIVGEQNWKNLCFNDTSTTIG